MSLPESVAADVRRLLEALPPGSHDGVSESSGEAIAQLDDYPIQWQLSARPADPHACPLDLVASPTDRGDCAWGFFFDTRGRVASLLGLGPDRRTAHIVAFGTEPVSVSPQKVIDIVRAVIEGRVELRYRTLGRRLMQTSGEVLVPGDPRRFAGYGLPLGARKVFRYAPWSGAARAATAKEDRH